MLETLKTRAVALTGAARSVAALTLAGVVAAPAFAQGNTGPDLTAMTDAFAVDTVVAAILAIGAAAMAIWLALIGYRYVKRMTGSA